MHRFTLLVPIVLALAAPATTAAPAAPNDSQPWWSPNAGELAFQREAPGVDGSHVIFAPAVRGTEVDIIGAGRPRGFRPGEGQLLVQLGNVTSIRDAQDRQLGTVPGTDATWSPDGTRVAYVNGDSLWVADAAGRDPRLVESGIVRPVADVTGPVLSPDGTELALSTATQLLAIAVDGSGSRSLADGDNANPSWSFDGAQVAFERVASGRVTIWLVAPSGAG